MVEDKDIKFPVGRVGEMYRIKRWRDRESQGDYTLNYQILHFLLFAVMFATFEPEGKMNLLV